MITSREGGLSLSCPSSALSRPTPPNTYIVVHSLREMVGTQHCLRRATGADARNNSSDAQRHPKLGGPAAGGPAAGGGPAAALWLLLAPVQGGGGGGDADCGAALVMTAHFPLERHLEVRDRPRNSTPHAPPTRTRAHARSHARARMHARTRPTPHMRPARSRP